MFKKAKESTLQDDWRIYRHQRNLVDRLNKKNKQDYYSKRLNINTKDKKTPNNVINNVNLDRSIGEFNTNDGKSGDNNEHNYSDKKMWKTVKDLTNTNKNQPPRLISYKDEIVTSIKRFPILQMNFILVK